MLATKRVLECDRILSLQRNGQPLKHELCLTWFLCNPCYSSTQLGNKLQCQLVPCSTRLDCESTKWCVLAKSVYFAVLFAAALSVAAVALVDVSPMYELANVSGMVMSHASGLPLVHGICVEPSGLCHPTSTNPLVP